MAHQERTEADGSSARGSGGSSRTGKFLAIAVALIVIGGGLAVVGLSEDPVEGELADDPREDARQVGAGTLPDGEADEFQEGLGNETTQDDFIEPGAPTEDFTNPQLQVPEGGQPTVPSIDDLEPGPGVDDEVLDRMAPDDGAAPDSQGGEAEGS